MTKAQDNQKPDKEPEVGPETEPEPTAADAAASSETVTLISKDGEHEVQVRKPSADYSSLRFGYGYKEKN